jgi:type II secretory pathway component PulM
VAFTAAYRGAPLMLKPSIMEQVRVRIEGLAERDRRALRLGGIVLLPVLLIMLGVTLRDHLAARRLAIDEAQSLAARANAEIAARLAAGASLVDGPRGGATDRIARAIAAAGLQDHLVSLQATSPDATQVELALRDVAFDALVRELGRLGQREGVTIVSASLARSSPGRVEASLVLRVP